MEAPVGADSQRTRTPEFAEFGDELVRTVRDNEGNVIADDSSARQGERSR